jgi:hypothetical protein
VVLIYGSKIAANFRKSGKFFEFNPEECKFAILSERTGPIYTDIPRVGKTKFCHLDL